MPEKTPSATAAAGEPGAALHIYPPDALEKLGYTQIRERLGQLCRTPAGREIASAMAPLQGQAGIVKQLQLAQELLQLADGEAFLPVERLEALSPVLDQAQVEGNWLEGRHFLRVRKWLQAVRQLIRFVQQHQEEAPELANLLDVGDVDLSFSKEIARVLTDDGIVKPNASRELGRIRRAMGDLHSQLRKQLQQILSQAREKGWAAGAELALRNNRLTLPIKASMQSRIQGFVHDVSGSGQTVYLEPATSLELNNRLRELQLQERREIERILRELTDQLRPFIPGFRRLEAFTARLDVLQAKTQWARELQCTVPKVTQAPPKLHLKDGRHPQLIRKMGRAAVVPLSVELDEQLRMLVISGPNAGGKSVALKTLGLLQLLVQSGLPVPCHPDSVFPAFRRVMIDIGDDQSLQNDLSTYTSHLRHMQQMLQQADERSLLLIDEFGSGTDPALGGPMAQALLERYRAAGAWGVITTHYSDLKEYAETAEGIGNGAMTFDTDELSPKYFLKQGLPGNSFAFEMAGRAGIPQEVLQRARRLAGEERQQAEFLLTELQDQAEKVRTERAALAEEKEAMSEQKYRSAQKESYLDRERNRILREARAEAANIIQAANQRVEATIRQIKEEQAEKEATKQLRQELEEHRRALQPTPPEHDDKPIKKKKKKKRRKSRFAPETAEAPLQVGDRVKLKDGNSVGEVLAIEQDKVRVGLGQMEINLPRQDLVKLTGNEGTAARKPQTPKEVYATRQEAKMNIDLRGQRVEEALANIDRFMENAIVAGLPRLEILHGKGNGILREAIRNHLRANYPQVGQLHNAPEDQGGAGITIVEMNPGA